MRAILGLILFSALVSLNVSVQAETHPKVQSALDWQLPANDCALPEKDLRLKIVNEEGISEAGLGESPGKLRLREKRKKKFDKCVEKYKKSLVEDFGELKDVAQYGLTQDQADAILAKLSLIQAVITDPMAKAPATQ